MAVGQGFEPWKDLHPRWFSRPVHSTALPTHRILRSARIPLNSIKAAMGRGLVSYWYLTFLSKPCGWNLSFQAARLWLSGACSAGSHITPGGKIKPRRRTDGWKGRLAGVLAPIFAYAGIQEMVFACLGTASRASKKPSGSGESGGPCARRCRRSNRPGKLSGSRTVLTDRL